ncbi:MAG: T9SS type A sorting domain-containing protein [Flavobacteriales bacterium]|nr:T9SS type A sorting domain-containing protein [Flavobacteriales bacterium]
MKKLLLLLSIAVSMTATAQQMDHISWDYQGETREYLQYVPAVYDGQEAVPLVVALHGLGDTIGNFQGVGFQYVADTANFIVVYPQALEYIFQGLFNVGTAWNSGAGMDVPGFGTIYPNENIDDVGFLNALMDTVSSHYNIDQNRIYVTGFSMGGFMTNRMACELSNRVAATASVAGTIGSGITCNPGTTMRVCHFHGTSDTNVGYGTDGGGAQDNNFGMSVTEWLNFWTTNNGCGSVSLEGRFPDTANDGYTVDYLEYAGCTDNTRVVHYKVNGADHVWLPDSQSGSDVYYTLEIWKFFLGLSPNNLSLAGIADAEVDRIGVYPNPTTGTLRIDNATAKLKRIAVFNMTGQKVKEFSGLSRIIDVSDLQTGVYQIMVATEDGIFSNSFVKE